MIQGQGKFSLSYYNTKKEKTAINDKDFSMKLTAALDAAKSYSQLNRDIKEIEKKVNTLKLTASLYKGSSQSQINQIIKEIENKAKSIKLKANFDEKQAKKAVNDALKTVTVNDIKFNEHGIKLKSQKIYNDIKDTFSKTIPVNLEIKKENLQNQLTSYLTKNSKIRESSVLLKQSDELRNIFGNINSSDSLKYATEKFKLFKSEVTATGYATRSTTDKVKSLLSGFVKIGSAFGMLNLSVQKYRESLSTLKEMSTLLTEISKTSNMTDAELKKLGDNSFEVAAKYGRTASGYLEGVREMARSGYENLSKELGELSLLAQSAGDMTAEMANNYLLATDAAYRYNGSIEALTTALDGANYISNKNSASLSDIADGIRVSASYAAGAGVQINELTAAEATMVATTKRSGSEMGRAFRSILLNLQQVSGEFDGEIIDEEQLKKVEARCHSLGVELETMKDGMATLRNPMEVLKELASVYNSLPDNSADKQGLISDLGGKYHANALSALLGRWDLYEKMLAEFSQGSGSSMEEAMKTADSWEGRLNSLQDSWDSFVNSITNQDYIKGGISFLDRSIQGFQNLTETIGAIPVLLTAINTGMTAINKDYGITQLLNKDTGKIDLQGNAFGIDFTAIKAQKKHFTEAAEAIDGWNKKLRLGQTDINDFGLDIVKNNEQFKAYLQTCSKDAPASLEGYKAYLNAAGVSTDSLRLKTILLNAALTLGTTIAIQAVVTGISKLVQAQKELTQKTQDATESYTSSTKTLEEQITKYEELHKALLKNRGNEEETYSIKQQLLELQQELNEAYGDEYGNVNLVTEAYKDQTESLREYNKELANTYLNENEKGIKQAKNKMEEEKHYNLSYSGLSEFTDEGKVLKDLAAIYKDSGVELFADENGLFSIHLTADANDAYKVINSFTSDLRAMVKGTEMEDLVTDTFDLLSSELNRAGGTIEDFGDTYNKALKAEITIDDNLSQEYREAQRAVSDYNEAVLKSENPYDDVNVTKAYANLQKIKQGILENEAEWGKYSSVIDEVFESANTDKYDFYNSIKGDINSIKNEFSGLRDIDLLSMVDDDTEDGFDKLCSSAENYGLEVQDVIDLLVQLGIVQGVLANGENFIDQFALDDVLSSLSELESRFTILKSAQEELTESGNLAASTLEALSENNLLQYLEEVDGKLSITEAGLLAEGEAAKISAIQQLQAAASADIMALATEGVGGMSEGAQAAVQTVGNNAATAGTQAQTAAGQMEIFAQSLQDTMDAARGQLGNGEARARFEENSKKVMDYYTGLANGISNITISSPSSKSAKKSGKTDADKYLEEFKKELEKLDSLKERGKITELDYLQQLRVLYIKYFADKKKYLDEYEEYEHKYLSGLKSYYESVFSYISKLLSKKISALGDEKDAAVDSLKAQQKAAEENLKAQQKAIQAQIDSIQAQIDAKNKEIDAINEAADAVDRQKKLEEALFNQERAQEQKVDKVYAGKDKGFIYKVDETAIRDATEDVEDAKRDIRIAAIEKEIDLLDESIDRLEAQKDAIDDMIEASNAQFEAMIEQTQAYYDQLIESMQKYQDRWDELSELQEQADMRAALEEMGYTEEQILNMSEEAFQNLKMTYLSFLKEMNSGNDEIKNHLSELSNVNLDEMNGHLTETNDLFSELSGVDLTTAVNSMGNIETGLKSVSEMAQEAINALTGGGSGNGEQKEKGQKQDGNGESGNASSLEGAIQQQGEVANEVFPAEIEQVNALTEATDGTVESVNSIADALEKLHGTVIDTYVVNHKIEVDGTERPPIDVPGFKYGGKAEFAGTEGNSYASGSHGLKNREKDAIVAEFAPETVIYPNGTYKVFTEPTMTDLPKNTSVFNSEQTEALLATRSKSLQLGNNSIFDGYSPEVISNMQNKAIAENARSLPEFTGNVSFPESVVNESLNITFNGGINLQNVQDTDGFARAILTNLKAAVRQQMNMKKYRR